MHHAVARHFGSGLIEVASPRAGKGYGVDLTRLQERRRLVPVSVARSNRGIGEIISAAVGCNVEELDHEVGIGSG